MWVWNVVFYRLLVVLFEFRNNSWNIQVLMSERFFSMVTIEKAKWILFCKEKYFIYDVLRDLVQFVQFKKREKHPWRRKRFSDISGCIEIEHWFEIGLQSHA